MDVLFLSRFQFALTIMFHYLFPPLSIGLGTIMVLIEGMYLKTGNPQYEALARFWTRIFAVVFAMGVATGIVMEFEFGTNWATYSRYVGDVFGSALAAEGVFAFFLESGFLAVVVFGWDRVGKRMHFFATCMVALGSIFSAIWIIVANSWQQTPAGFHIVMNNGLPRAEITDFWAMVFNPSSMHRLLHSVIGAWILGAFFVMSIMAWYILKGRHVELAKKAFTIALIFGAVVSLGEAVSGHEQAGAVAKNQPAKLAAFEGHYRTGTEGTPLYLFGVPDSDEKRVKFGFAIPGGLSFLLYNNFTQPVPGLDRIPPADQPPVLIPFVSYHIMVGLGFYFIGITLLALWFRWRGTLFEKRWLLWTFVFSVLGPYAANQLGWVAAEVGRQPWVVYGLLRTSDALSKSVKADAVLASIILFMIIYLLLFVVWLYVMNEKIKHGIDEPQAHDEHGMLAAASALADPAGPSMTSARNGEGKE
jgi:cytochrome d ubiquinol oxidase subunit I